MIVIKRMDAIGTHKMDTNIKRDYKFNETIIGYSLNTKRVIELMIIHAYDGKFSMNICKLDTFHWIRKEAKDLNATTTIIDVIAMIVHMRHIKYGFVWTHYNRNDSSGDGNGNENDNGGDAHCKCNTKSYM